MEIQQLKADYTHQIANAERLREALKGQIEFMLSSVTLGVPIESRVKTWSSIEERLSRKPIELQKIADLDDLIGLRIILLFRRDLETALEAIRSQLDVLNAEDKASILTHTQFGYQSHHYIVRVPTGWQKIPSFSGLGHLKVELQIRTLAQHIWAAASHKLQYKQEDAVPPLLMRSIYRVSALLETVDLEFERVLDARRDYSASIGVEATSEDLNVDLLASILSKIFPDKNRKGDEPYAEFLDELIRAGITTGRQLEDIINRNLAYVLKEEKAALSGKASYRTSPERLARGVFFSHVGFARSAIKNELGPEWRDKAEGGPKK